MGKVLEIKDIANRLGIAVSTVSKGLNGASDISDDMRAIDMPSDESVPT